MFTAKRVSVGLGVCLVLGLIGGGIFWVQAASDAQTKRWQKANISQVLSDSDSFSQTYTNERYNFSVKYPESFQVGEFSEGQHTSIVIQDADNRQGFQVYVRSLDENIQLSEARLKQDVPDMEVSDVIPTAVDGVDNALAFDAHNEAFGESHEIWFVKNSTLFQISTYRNQRKLLRKVGETWEFEET